MRGVIRKVIACTFGANRIMLGLNFIQTDFGAVESMGKILITLLNFERFPCNRKDTETSKNSFPCLLLPLDSQPYQTCMVVTRYDCYSSIPETFDQKLNLAEHVRLPTYVFDKNQCNKIEI